MERDWTLGIGKLFYLGSYLSPSYVILLVVTFWKVLDLYVLEE